MQAAGTESVVDGVEPVQWGEGFYRVISATPQKIIRGDWEPKVLEEGKTPKYLDVSYFYLCSCLALGWLYQVWYTYDSLPTPVELHLRKTIRKKPLVAYWPAGIQMNQSPLARQPSEVRVIVETHDVAENENAKFRESVARGDA